MDKKQAFNSLSSLLLIVCKLNVVMNTNYASTAKRQDDVSRQSKNVNVKDHLSAIELADILKGIKYPADKNTILNSVIGRNTDKKISELLGQIEDKLYNNASEVATATGLVEKENK